MEIMSPVVIGELAEKARERSRNMLGATVLAYLASNPGLFDDARGFAVWLGVTVAELRPVLDILCDRGILQSSGSDDNLIYSLVTEVVDEQLVEPLLASLEAAATR